MWLEYLGHACFYFEDSRGTRVIVDPYDRSVGYSVRPRRADFTLITHNHADHANLDAVLGATRVMTRSGSSENGRFAVQSVLAFHDAHEGHQRGVVNMMVFEMDGVRIAHLSDLGHPLTAEHVALLGDVDLALVPVGGPPFTIDGATAREVVARLNPRAVIPMHYLTASTNRANYPIADVRPFLDGIPGAVYVRDGRLELTHSSLPNKRTIYVLTPTM